MCCALDMVDLYNNYPIDERTDPTPAKLVAISSPPIGFRMSPVQVVLYYPSVSGCLQTEYHQHRM